jgi:hypothetical protein
MSKLDKFRAIIDASLQGAGKSKLTNEVIDSVGGFISPNIRHLLNNLGEISTNYVDCGSHVGSSLISTVYGNDNLKSAIAIDNWSLFSSEQHDSRSEFFKNCDKFIYGKYKAVEKDCYTVTKQDLPNQVDLYLYDAGHSAEETAKGITWFKQFMADEFILLVDDFWWDSVQLGTWNGIKEAGLNIIWATTLDNGIRSSCSESGWWNGYFCALVKK